MSSAPKRAGKNISEHTVVGARNPFDDAFDARTIVAPRASSAAKKPEPPPAEETVIAMQTPPPPSPKIPSKMEESFKLEPLVAHPSQPGQSSRQQEPQSQLRQSARPPQANHSFDQDSVIRSFPQDAPASAPGPVAAQSRQRGLPKFSLLVGIALVLGLMFFYWDGLPSAKKQARVPTAEEVKPALSPEQMAIHMAPPPRPMSLNDVLLQFDQAYGATQSTAHASGLQ